MGRTLIAKSTPRMTYNSGIRAGMGSFSAKRQSCRPKRGGALVRSASILRGWRWLPQVLKVHHTVTDVLTLRFTARSHVLGYPDSATWANCDSPASDAKPRLHRGMRTLR